MKINILHFLFKIFLECRKKSIFPLSSIFIINNIINIYVKRFFVILLIINILIEIGR